MVENMIGSQYERITVTRHYYEKISETRNRDFCDGVCQCGNLINHIRGTYLRVGNVRSCGCLRNDMVRESVHRTNEYYMFDSFIMIGIDYKGNEFLFNKERYDLIKDFSWSVNKEGYVRAYDLETGNKIFLHNLIMGKKKGYLVDHKNRNPRDNTDENLRFANFTQNNTNKKIQSNNESGIIGVRFIDRCINRNWNTYIRHPKTKKVLNFYFSYFEEAVLKRLLLEKEYYGEFAPQRDLFEEFGIEP